MDLRVAQNLSKDEALLLFADLKQSGIESSVISEVSNGFEAYHVEVESDSVDLYNLLHNGPAPKTDENTEYLSELDNWELIDILDNRHEYNRAVLQKVSSLVKSRGINYDDHEYEQKYHAQIKLLEYGLEANTGQIFAAYLKALLGGLTGMLQGWEWYYAEETGPNNLIYKKYAYQTRVHGFRVLILGLFSMVIIALLVGYFW